jgi:2-polyprenyl-3-methyl-5-hydroxy-6-metoxy-1,4-benzoquinol methylase
MHINRRLNNWIRYVLEQLVPPAIRDSEWFMRVPMRVVFGRDYQQFMRFKRDAVTMTPHELQQVYEKIEVSPLMVRPTDLNEPCVERILKDIGPFESVLDVGCGRGYLAGQMATIVKRVTGVDFYIDPNMPPTYPRARFVQSDLERLCFPDGSFDVVTCTHTLEHVQHLDVAVSELRRVARRLVILVVPKERPYRHTLNLHLHFFPYAESLLFAVKPRSRKAECFELAGDLYYREPLV